VRKKQSEVRHALLLLEIQKKKKVLRDEIVLKGRRLSSLLCYA